MRRKENRTKKKKKKKKNEKNKRKKENKKNQKKKGKFSRVIPKRSSVSDAASAFEAWLFISKVATKRSVSLSIILLINPIIAARFDWYN